MNTDNENFTLKRIQEFCALHPDDPVFRVQLAEMLFKLGSNIRAIYALRKAHALYLNDGNITEANRLVTRYSHDVDSRKAKYLGEGGYTVLEKHFNKISAAMKKVSHKEDSVVYRKGDPADFFYLVLEGELAAIHQTKSGHSLLGCFRQGDLFGEHIDAPEEASDDELEHLESELKMYRGSAVLNEEKSPQSQEKSHKPRQVMYRGAWVDAVDEGPQHTSSKPVMYRGSIIGTEAQAEKVRNVTMIVQQDCTLLKFTQKDLDKALSKYPKLQDKFTEEQQVQHRLANISLSSLFTCLPPDLRLLLAKRSQLITPPSGEAFNQPGSYLPQANLIVRGHMHLFENTPAQGENYCGRLSPGDILGVEKIAKSEAPNITYKPSEDCQLIQIELNTIADVITLSKQFRTLLVKYIAFRSTQTSRIMRLWNEGADDI